MKRFIRLIRQSKNFLRRKLPTKENLTDKSKVFQREVHRIRPASSHDLTVLIPSKNRPEDLAKILQYFSNENLPYKVIIVAEGAGYEDVCARESRLSIELLQLKAKSLAGKIVEGLKRVSTPLVSVCSDHDIVFTEAIAKSSKTQSWVKVD